MLAVTVGVILTTLSASGRGGKKLTKSEDQITLTGYTSVYLQGIAILTLGLVLSGFLGLVQDWANTAFNKAKTGKESALEDSKLPPAWAESMFYLHFLSLPVFITARRDLLIQAKDFVKGPQLELALPSIISSLVSPDAKSRFSQTLAGNPVLIVPSSLVTLVINTFTQLFCLAGVNRLTARVSSLTVTLTLVVRKAVSLLISEAFLDVVGRTPMDKQGRLMMWSGALLVFAGTVGYTLGGLQRVEDSAAKKKED